MEDIETKYQAICKESTENENELGLFLGGSRGKSKDFLTKYSDMDVYVILSDSAPEELKQKIESYKSEYFEMRAYGFDEFKNYAAWGSEKEWDRYNFSHNTAVIDKTDEIQKIMDEKGTLPKQVQKKVAAEALDSYINQVYRSAKYFRDGNKVSAYLDASESLPYLMTTLYSLEGRLKPYNKYFEWELKNYPLKFLPWSVEEFIADYLDILKTGNSDTQAKVFKGIKKLFIDHGFNETIDGWKNYYFVGK